MDPQTKENIKKKVESQLDELLNAIDTLEAKAKTAKADLQVKYAKEIETLKTKKTDLQAKFDVLKKSGDEAWDVMKVGVEKAAAELKTALDQAIAKFKKPE